MPEISREKLIREMLRSACEFVEFYTAHYIDYFRCYGYKGPDPCKFHPSSSDKLIIREYMERYAETISDDFIGTDYYFARIYALRALFLWYYPNYDEVNRKMQE